MNASKRNRKERKLENFEEFFYLNETTKEFYYSNFEIQDNGFRQVSKEEFLRITGM